MAIELKELQSERDILQKDFDNLSGRIKQVDKLIAKDSGTTSEKQLLTEKEPMPVEKQAALNVATS